MTNEELRSRHTGDIVTLWKIYESDNPFYKNFYFKTSLIISSVLCILSTISSISSYDLILIISDVGLGSLPTLLGFNLGAYILVVGFGGSDILAIITKPLKKQNNYSFYQKLNGVLGFSVIVQILTFFLSFLIRIWNAIQLKISWNLNCFFFLKMMNFCFLLVVLFLMIYSFLLLLNVVKHVFMFAQTIHLCIYKNELQKGDKPNNQESLENEN